MTRPSDDPEYCGCGAHPTRRKVLQTGLATAAGLALSPSQGQAQISGVGVAEGTLPGRTAPHTLEGTSSMAVPRQRLGVDIHAHYYPQAYLDVMAEDGKPFGGEYTPTRKATCLGAAAFPAAPSRRNSPI